MAFERSSGILLHPTSLPGKYGIGDLGPNAYHFLDQLAASNTKLWQVLPLGPTGYGDSPYQCFSAFAGNPYMISIDLLIDWGLLRDADLESMPVWSSGVDFGAIFEWKPGVLRKAYLNFMKLAPKNFLTINYEVFITREAYWLEEYALFMAIKSINGGAPWNQWEEKLRNREKDTLDDFAKANKALIDEQKFLQFAFFTQWANVKNYANERGIKIIGDIPIFVAMDSADVWGNPELFYLDGEGQPTVVAGVPPDYFSDTGQLWGNPLFKWDVHEKTEYAWWIRRVNACLNLFDVFRIDHFRGFASYWEVPFGETTAVNGRWVKGPGSKLFKAIKKAFGDLPIIAEDLGEITPDVIELRDEFDLPGMKIYQFAFSGPDNPFLPHLYPQNCVVYTGSHDNDTAWGWYHSAPQHEKDYYHEYTRRGAEDVPGDMVNAIWKSTAVFAVAPIQDLLGLGGDCRMNFPGKTGGYWSWRMNIDAFSDDLVERLKRLNYLYLR